MKWPVIAVIAILIITLTVSISNNLQKQRARDELIRSVTAFNDLFCSGVYVDGIALGGMGQQ